MLLLNEGHFSGLDVVPAEGHEPKCELQLYVLCTLGTWLEVVLSLLGEEVKGVAELSNVALVEDHAIWTGTIGSWGSSEGRGGMLDASRHAMLSVGMEKVI